MALLPGLLTRHWRLKLAALALAVLLWTVPRFEAQSRQVLEDVPVRVQLTDPRWALLGAPEPPVVRATLSGPAREIFALALDRPPVVVPVDSVVRADTIVQLRYSWLPLLGHEGVTVEELAPAAVRLSFEPIIDAEPPFALRLAGTLPQGLSLAVRPELTPSRARVSGPASRVEEIDSLPLVPLDLSDVTTSGGYAVTVDTAGLRGLVIAPLTASAQVEVEETIVRSLPDLPLSLPDPGGAPPPRAVPDRVSVTLIGARSLVEAVEAPGVRVSVPESSVRNLAPGQEAQVLVTVEGLPDLVEAQVRPPWVLLQRPVGR